MQNVIEHKFFSEEIFFIYPQGEKGNFLTDMIVKVSEGQEGYLIENNKVIKQLRIGTNSIVEPFLGFAIFLTKKNIQKKWGTLEPVPFKDKSHSLTYAKAYGTIDFSIEDGTKFIEGFIREKDIYLTEEFMDFLRNLAFYEFSNILKEKMEFLNNQENLKDSLEDLMKRNLNSQFKNIGLKLLNFSIIGSNIFEEEKEKICLSCFKGVPQEAIYCPFCGQKISNKCPSCHKEIPEFAKFCPFCGKRLASNKA